MCYLFFLILFTGIANSISYTWQHCYRKIAFAFGLERNHQSAIIIQSIQFVCTFRSWRRVVCVCFVHGRVSRAWPTEPTDNKRSARAESTFYLAQCTALCQIAISKCSEPPPLIGIYARALHRFEQRRYGFFETNIPLESLRNNPRHVCMPDAHGAGLKAQPPHIRPYTSVAVHSETPTSSTMCTQSHHTHTNLTTHTQSHCTYIEHTRTPFKRTRNPCVLFCAAVHINCICLEQTIQFLCTQPTPYEHTTSDKTFYIFARGFLRMCSTLYTYFLRICGLMVSTWF